MSEPIIYRARLQSELLADPAEICAWYEDQAEGVGFEFARAFYAAVASVTRQPLLMRVVGSGFRRVRLRRFPYSLYYEVERDEVIFCLLFHGGRDPKLLRRTLLARRADLEGRT